LSDPPAPTSGTGAPLDVVALLDELQAIGRTGLHYAEDPFDRARCERLVEIAARGYAEVSGLDVEEVRNRFRTDIGYVTAKVGADGAVFDDDGRILLIRRADDNRWGLVAGWVDPNESPEQTLAREFLEELGVAGRVEELAGVFHRPANSGTGPHSVISVVYLCSITSRAFTFQPHEVLDAQWCRIEDVTEWHLNHDVLANGARDAWRRRRGNAAS
jgi:ADP-ribose pyrophosphatase YjhB (NUDIX family)